MAEHPPKSSFKEVLTSITIAFVLAFVFRAFVIEAFVIPTGSMAPTLMGAHVRAHGPLSGYDFPVGPVEAGRGAPSPLQSATVSDLMLGPSRAADVTYENKPRRAGDRILVLKYLLGVFDPQRFDVVVFKSPVAPQTNFIKRLLGLPGEQIALIDGDVFVRDGALADDLADAGPWSQPGWEIARKPERVQRAVWQDVFDSFYTPRETAIDGRVIFRSPWEGQGWNTDEPGYRYEGAGATTLQWNQEDWPIDDRYPYNESVPGAANAERFPVSDIRLRAGVQPDQTLSRIAAVIVARSHEFKAEIEADEARLAMRPIGGEWTVIDAGPVALEPGRVTNIEFWHVDQSLQLWIDDKKIAEGQYDWTPEERILYATGETLQDLLESRNTGIFARPNLFGAPTARWEFGGGPLTLHRVALQRDLHYRSTIYNSPGHQRIGQPSAASHPDQPVNLTSRQYFACGDNSPSSADSRLWDRPDPWVAEIDPTISVVAKELMIGRAFFVYFPSPLKGSFGLPIPDAGRLRLIW